MDYSEGYAEYGERGEYSDVSLWSDLGSDYGKDPPMEVEEVLHGDSLADSVVYSAISGNDDPLPRTILPKDPPRRFHLGISKPARVKLLEATSSRRKLPLPGHTTPELMCLHLSLIEERGGDRSAQPRAWQITLSPFVSVPVSVSIPVSVVILVPVLPPCPACTGPCWVARSSGFTIWRWRTGSCAVEEGLCH
ncbi:hypothetical protein P4O66_013447, partial [Electrophorus voltai]